MIDWNFIEQREGRRYVGYVPEPKTSKSGVTIGVGVDIGHMTDAEFTSLPHALQDKIEPYRHLVGMLAIQKLRTLPLMLGTDEVNTLDKIIFDEISGEVCTDYDHAVGHGEFDSLPSQCQTVLVSVAFQYGVLAAKCPHFWLTMISKDWHGAVHELENFGDEYGERRKLEAALIGQIL